jgi:hypothetical protein
VVFHSFGEKIRRHGVPVNVSRETDESSTSLLRIRIPRHDRGSGSQPPRFHRSIHKVIHSDIHWVMHRVMHRGPGRSGSADCCRHCNGSTQSPPLWKPAGHMQDQSETFFRSGQSNKMKPPHRNSTVVRTITLWAAAMMIPAPQKLLPCSWGRNDEDTLDRGRDM